MYQLRTSTYGLITLRPFDPSHHQGPLLAGSTIARAEGNFGTLTFQQYQGNHFIIALHQLLFRKKTLLDLPVPDGHLQSVSCIKGHGHHCLNGKKTLFRQGQYFLSIPAHLHQIQLERDTEFSNLTITYHLPALSPMIPFFPIISYLLNDPHHHLLNRHAWMNKHLYILVEQILHSWYEPALRDFLFKERMEDLLQSMLIELNRQPLHLNNFSPSDIQKIHKAHALILENVRKHHNIQDLARKVELNEFKIKEGFRQLFGKGPFGILRDARMQIAYDLLLHTNRPEKDIMSEAGFTSLTAFVKAFRSVYGIPPGHLRSKSGNQP